MLLMVVVLSWSVTRWRRLGVLHSYGLVHQKLSVGFEMGRFGPVRDVRRVWRMTLNGVVDLEAGLLNNVTEGKCLLPCVILVRLLSDKQESKDKNDERSFQTSTVRSVRQPSKMKTHSSSTSVSESTSMNCISQCN